MELPDAQLQQLVSLIELYVGNMDDGHARVKMKEVLAHMDGRISRGSARRSPAACSTTGFRAR